MINIALDAGSGLAGKTVSPIMREINSLLDEVFTNEICEEFDDVSIVLRVSGAVHDFGFIGCEQPKLNKRERSVEIDVGVSEDFWSGESSDDLREKLGSLVSEAILISYKLLLEKKVLSDISPVEHKLKVVFQTE